MTDIFGMDAGRLELSDCMDFLATLEDNSIDLVLVDPPYFTIMKNEWDNQWDTEDAYLSWCKNWVSECARVLKPGRCFYVWGTTKTDTFLRFKLDVMNSLQGFFYQNWIIWSYDWGGRSSKTFARKHEDLIMYSKGEDFLFNDVPVRVPYKMQKNIRSSAKNHADGKIPTSVWEHNNHTTSKEYVDWHPTQKPLSLLKRIICANTNPGDCVLDIFSGSGSTAIACDNTSRTFFGCEADETYFLLSKKRRLNYHED